MKLAYGSVIHGSLTLNILEVYMSSWIQVIKSFARSKAERRRNLFILIGVILAMGLLSFSILTTVNAKTQNSGPPARQSSFAGNEYKENQLIIKFKAKLDNIQKYDLLKGLNPVTLRKLSLIGAELIQISGVSVEDAINSIKYDPRIEYVEPNYIWHTDIIPNDPDFSLLWGMHNTGQTGGTVDADIDAVEAWNITTGGSVIIGVIDTGVDTAHVELHSNIWTNPGEIPGNGIDDDGNGYIDDMHGWDFVNWDNGPIDDHGHGTHCSGTIAGIGNNSVGVAGVCWSAKIMALKFLNSGGSGSTSNAILAVEYATMMGANLTSNSWGGGSYSQALKDAIDSSGAHGMLFVASAGNSWNNNDANPVYPCSYVSDNIISVAATNHNDNLADEGSWGSNWGPTSVDLGAPGVNIYSLAPGNGYRYASGTSMACPHVSGASALTWSKYPSLTYLQVKQRIMDMTDPKPSLAGKCVTGGRLNVFMVMAEPDSIPPSPISDLAVIGTEGSRITLSWIATGDDSNTGTASSYDVRYSLSPIDSINFNSATQTLGEPNPKPAGLPDTFMVRGLDFSTPYYFAIKALDEWGNSSGVSNSPSGTTLGPPDISFSPDSLYDSLFTGETSTQLLTIYNSGVSDLFFDISLEGATSLSRDNLKINYRKIERAAVAINSDIQLLTVPSNKPYSFGHSAFRQVINPGEIEPKNESVNNLKILLLVGGGSVSEIQTWLLSFPDISVVDVFDAYSAVPTLDTLLKYHSVIVMNNNPFGNPVGIGNVLADYADAGGGVILTLACFASGFEIQGRFLNEGYMPFNIGSGPVGSASLGSFNPRHPIMEGVTTAYGDLLASVTLATGAESVAEWDNGLPFVATQGANVAAVNIYIAYPGYWIGDIPLILHNAAFWSSGGPWLSADPTSGIIPAGDSMEITISFDAEGLNGGDYYAGIVISSNDPDEPEVTVPAHLHVTGAPDIAVSPDSLDYDSVFISVSMTDTLVVSNEGTDSLIVKEILSDHPNYTVSSDSFSLAPEEEQEVLVTFSPSDTGLIEGTLTIKSNDPGADSILNVYLRGVGLIPPEIVVYPDSLRDSLFTGDTSIQFFTIRNEGGSNLIFEVGVEPVESLKVLAQECMGGITRTGEEVIDGRTVSTFTATELEQFKQNLERYYQGVVSLLAGRDLPTIAVAGSYSGDMMYCLMQDTSLVSRYVFYEVYDNYNYDLIKDYDGLIICEYDYSISYDEAVAVNTYYQSGRPVLMGMDDLDDEPIDVKALVFPVFGISNAIDGNYYWGSLNPDNPITEGITQVYAFGSDNDWYTLADADWIFAGTDGNYYGVSYKGEGKTVVMGENLASIWYAGNGPLIRNAIDWMMEGARWLSVFPESGIVPVGDSMQIQVTFNTEGMYGGDYAADIVVSSNDPDESEVTVPAHLHVTGAPDIVVFPDSLDYDSVFIGVSIPDTIIVSNAGTDLLNVREIISDHPNYTVNPDSFSLSPKEKKRVPVTFSPSDTGLILGTLTIKSNDPQEDSILTVYLRGVGLIPPDIVVAPDSLRDSLFTGDSSIQFITIRNDGGSNLIFEVGVEPVESLKVLAQECMRGITRTGEEVIDGQSIPTFNASELEQFKTNLTKFYQEGIGLSGWSDLLTIAVVGSYTGDMMYYLMQDTSLVSRYVFYGVYDYYDTSFIKEYDGLIICEYDYGISYGEAIAVSAFYQSGKPVLMGMDDLDDEPSDVRTLVFPIFGISNATDGVYYWGSLNPDNPITAGIGQVYPFADGDNDWYTLAGADWIFAGTDGNHYGVSYKGEGKTALMGENLEYIWGVGNGPLIRNAIDWMMEGARWLSVFPESGVLPVGDSAILQVTFNAEGMYGGDYNANIVITNNDPDEPEVTVPTHLHVTGAPDIVVTPDSLDYDSVFISVSVTDTVIVSNEGTDLLSVREIISDHPNYTVNPDSFSLAPEGKQAVMVTFSPSDTGLILGTLTIKSNDPQADSILTVYLRGVGLIPPDIVVTPDSLRDSLFTGDTSTQILTISNIGVSDLFFDISFEAVDNKTQSAKRISALNEPRSSHKMVLFDPKDYQISDAPIGEKLTQDNIGNLHKVESFSITKKLSSKSFRILLAYSDDGGSYLAGQLLTYPDIESVAVFYTSYGAPSLELLLNYDAVMVWNNWYPSDPIGLGNVLADYVDQGGGVVIGAFCFSSLYSIQGRIMDTSYTPLVSANIGNHYSWADMIILDPSHPIMKNVTVAGDYYRDYTVLTSGSDLIAHWSDGENFVAAKGAVIGINSYVGDYFLWSGDIPSIVHNSLVFSATHGARWLSMNPNSGVISTGDSMEIEVTFDATGMYGGDYNANILISSNDPDEPVVTVPAYLHVTGAPDIAVTPDSLDYDSVFISVSVTDTVIVSNEGTDLLSVREIISDHPNYTVNPDSFSLSPKEKKRVPVTFSPSDTGLILGTLTIKSNDPQEDSILTVYLRGVGLIPPDIVVAPDSLRDSLFTGDSSIQFITIRNDGGSNLIFEVGVEPVESLKVLAQECMRGITRTGEEFIDGRTVSTFTATELEQFKQNLERYYQGVKNLPSRDDLLTIAVVGDDTWDMMYYIMQDTSLTNRYVFNGVYYYYDTSFIMTYDGLIICEYGNGISYTEAVSVNAYYQSGKPVLLGMYYLGYAPNEVKALVYPVFGISGANLGNYYWGSINPDNPITEGIGQVYSFYGYDDWYTPAGADWIFAGTDANYYGVSYEGEGRTVLMGDNLATIWYAGNGPLIRNAINWMMEGVGWLSVFPESGIVPKEDSMQIQVTFNAEGMYGGDYNANILISNNDPDEPVVTVPAYLHVTGAPDIAVTPDSLDYDSVFISVSVTDTVIVSNEGTDLLSVREIISDHPNYTVNPDSFSLAPEEKMKVLVTFSPSDTGLILGTLTIKSNDPQEDSIWMVYLRGVGLIPPDIVVTPDSLRDSLFTGDTSTQVLRILNTGASNLIFNITIEDIVAVLASISSRMKSTTPHNTGHLPLVEIGKGEEDTRVYPLTTKGSGGPDQFGYRWKDSHEPGGPTFDWIDVSGGTSIYLSDDDFETGIPLGFTFNYYGTDFNEIGVGSNGWMSFNDVDSWYPSNVPAVDGYAGPLAPFARDIYPPNGNYIRYQTFGSSPNRRFVIEYNHIPDCCAWENPKTFELILYEGSNNIRFQYLIAPNDPFGFGIESPDETMGMGNAGIDSLFINPTTVEDNYTIEFSIQPDWLTLNPVFGTISPGDSLDITVTFDATGMYGGNYNADIKIYSNDPDEPEVTIPTHLHVTGAPYITLSKDSLEYGSVFIGASVTDTLIVFNEGTDLLTVKGITSDHPDYSANIDTFSLTVGDSQLVLVTFAPSLEGEILGVLTIRSNDPDSIVTVFLRGVGLEPPDISVSPGSMEDSLFTGDTSTQVLTISNTTGGSDLFFHISIKELTISASSPLTPHPISLASRDPLSPRISGQDQKLPERSKLTSTLFEHMKSTISSGFSVFFDDMESGINGWTTEAYEVDDLWHQTQISSNSPVTSWWCGIEGQGNYNTGNRINTAAISPSIDLRHYNPPITLQFFESYNTEWGWDYCMVDVTTDGGTSWVSLRGGYGSAPSGNSGGWIMSALDLSFYAGKVIQIRYYFDTGDGAANNYPGWFFDDVLVTAAGIPWLTVNPIEGIVVAGDSLDLLVTFNATGMYGGDYNANIMIYSNDPDEPEVTIPTHLHVTGAPCILFKPDSFDFDSTFIGDLVTDTLIVTNCGTDLLTVWGITSDHPNYSTDIDTFGLAVGDSQLVLVTFAPTLEGEILGTLTIRCNDPNDSIVTIPLRGVGLEPPDISVSPGSLEDSLFTGDTSMQVLTISNTTGGSDLIFDISIVEVEPFSVSAKIRPTPFRINSNGEIVDQRTLGRSLSKTKMGNIKLSSQFQSGDTTVFSNQPPSDYQPIWMTTPIITGKGDVVLIIQDAAPWGNSANEQILDSNGINYDMINTSLISTTDFSNYNVILIPSDQPTSFYQTVASFVSKFNSYVAIGGILEFHCAGWGSNGGNSSLVTLPGGMNIIASSSVLNYVLDPSHPLVNGVPNPFTGNFASHAYFTDIPANAVHIVENQSGYTNLVEYTYGHGVVIASGQTLEFGFENGEAVGIILTNMIPYAFGLERTNWLYADPTSGYVPTGSSLDIEVSFDATGMYAGDYNANILISSNDPDEPQVTVSVRLTCLGNKISPFSLLLPQNKSFVPKWVHFDWETATCSDLGDSVTYDLYLSTAYLFPEDSTTIDSNLVESELVKFLDIGTYYWKVKAKDKHGAERWCNQEGYFIVTELPVSYLIGDFNSDGYINLGDVVFAINYLYKSGPAPDPIEFGDCNCDGNVDVGDVIYLINYLFKGGPVPGC